MQLGQRMLRYRLKSLPKVRGSKRATKSLPRKKTAVQIVGQRPSVMGVLFCMLLRPKRFADLASGDSEFALGNKAGSFCDLS